MASLGAGGFTIKKIATSAVAAALVLPLGVLLASPAPASKQARGPDASADVFVPESSIPQIEDFGVRMHTNHLIYTGPWFDRSDEDGTLEAALFPSHGPSLGKTFAPSGYSPAQIRIAYNLPSTGGSGAIAIVDAFHYGTALNDFNVFAGQFSLPKETSTNATASTNKVFQIVYQGTTQPAGNASWNEEEALDIEWAHALAPSAKIYLVEANSASDADLFAAAKKAATLVGVKEVSMSFGGSEFSGETTYDTSFTGTSGVVFFASAGDTGGEKEYPSESPSVVGVGGTTLTLKSNKFSSETAWSGSGGGASAYEGIPSYQSVISSIVGKKRGCPDIALDANPSTGVAVYDSTNYAGNVGWLVFGGTSVASPCCASIANLSGHALGSSAAELARIYKELGTSAFRDITSGTAGSNKAKAGWDFVTGAGAPLGTGAL